MNTENSKTNEPHKLVFNLSRILDLSSSNKYVALQNVSIYYTQQNITKQHKNNKLKIIASTLLNISLNISLATIYPIQVYINRTNNRLVFKIKDGCKLQLQTPEKNEIIWKHKKIKRQNKKCRKSTKP